MGTKRVGFAKLANTPKKYGDLRSPYDLRELDFSTEEIGMIEQWAYDFSQREFVSRDHAYHAYSMAAFVTGSSNREELEAYIERHFR